MPKAYITRRVEFCASHRLHSERLSDEENRRIFDKCNNPNGHGHNYALEVTVGGEIDPITGMVMNLASLKEILDSEILEPFDHRHLNLDVAHFRHLNPTGENLAVVIWGLLKAKLPPGLLQEVKVYENDNNIMSYRGE